VTDGQELPLLWHHGLDPEIGRGPIGRGTVKRTPAGLWFQSWLNRRDEYENYIHKMIELGKAGYSSGADPKTVVRQPLSGKAGAFHIARWKIVEGSVTPIPADSGNRVSIKSLMAASSDWSDVERVYGKAYAADLRREIIEDDLRALELTMQLDALESPAERKARILRELDTIEGPRRTILVPGGPSGTLVEREF
jgi:hypothetical protein